MERISTYPRDPVEFISAVINKAVKANTTDIHWEPSPDDIDKGSIVLVVRFRIDGILQDVLMIGRQHISPDMLINALKIMAGMDITKKRKEQDGRATFNAEGIELDLRFSSMPVILGERIVMRLIHKQRYCMRPEDLGIAPEGMKLLLPIASRKEGFLLIVGPTGVGKTTTLYAMLNFMYSRKRNICTIEDPVECRISGFNQIQIEHDYGMTFVNGLRAIMRQDPDITAVGEIRDAETARTAFQAALAGSLVFSTLHARNCINAIARLLEMDVEPYFLSTALTDVISVRLVRLFCKECQGKGCPDCGNSGFKGRTGMFEIMKVTDKIRKLILHKATQDLLKNAALEAGMYTFQEAASRLVASGLTSKDEVNKAFTLYEI